MQTADAVSVRTYLAIEYNNVQKSVLVGVDANGNDLIDEKPYSYRFKSAMPVYLGC